MGNLGIGIGVGVGLNGANFLWSAYWTFLTSGLIIYRKGQRDNHYVIDYSADGGATWELGVVTLELDENNIIINIDAGVTGYRQSIRNNDYCIDHILTPTGFNGVEGVDWENVFIITK